MKLLADHAEFIAQAPSVSRSIAGMSEPPSRQGWVWSRRKEQTVTTTTSQPEQIASPSVAPLAEGAGVSKRPLPRAATAVGLAALGFPASAGAGTGVFCPPPSAFQRPKPKVAAPATPRARNGHGRGAERFIFSRLSRGPG